MANTATTITTTTALFMIIVVIVKSGVERDGWILLFTPSLPTTLLAGANATGCLCKLFPHVAAAVHCCTRVFAALADTV